MLTLARLLFLGTGVVGFLPKITLRELELILGGHSAGTFAPTSSTEHTHSLQWIPKISHAMCAFPACSALDIT